MYKISEQYTDNEGRVWKDLTIYNGETYPVRVAIDKDGDEQLIAGFGLLETIHPQEEWTGDDSKDYDPANPQAAKEVDEAIFFFTDETTLYYSESALREELKSEHPEWFSDEEDKE